MTPENPKGPPQIHTVAQQNRALFTWIRQYPVLTLVFLVFYSSGLC
jgi:hypothetical protein